MPTDSPLRMPGATLMTRLKVYDTVSPDGQRGGTPHVHLLCTELYFVLAGQGAVELIDADGFSKVELLPHSALLFSPGTIHRLINPDGDLELLVLMANSGLPERGDNVVCFPEALMGKQARYDEAMAVSSVEEAYQRRDRGVTGFLELKAAFDAGAEAGCEGLRRFFALAAQRVTPRLPAWEEIINRGARAEVERTRQRLDALKEADSDYLLTAQQHLIRAGAYHTPGFCGHLNRYFDPASLTLEGISQP